MSRIGRIVLLKTPIDMTASSTMTNLETIFVMAKAKLPMIILRAAISIIRRINKKSMSPQTKIESRAAPVKEVAAM